MNAFKNWSRSDTLSALSLVLGLVGFIWYVIQVIAPVFITDTVYFKQYRDDIPPNINRVSTIFQNTSYSSPVKSISAEWTITGQDIQCASGPGGPVARWDTIPGSNAITMRLETQSELPARAGFRTEFNSPQPIQVTFPTGVATYLKARPDGFSTINVRIISDDDFRGYTYYSYGLVLFYFALYVAGFAALFWVAKRFS